MIVKTFTGSFKGFKNCDETHYAKIVSDSIRSDHHEVFPAHNDFLDNIEKLTGEHVLLFVQDLLADGDALVADVDPRPGDQAARNVGALPAERADLLSLIS